MRFPIRLTEEQYRIIKLRAQLSGFNTISAYARDRLSNSNIDSERKLREICKTLAEQKQNTGKKDPKE